MFKRIISTILLFCTLILSACSTFPMEKNKPGLFTSDEGLTFEVLVGYQHEDTEELFNADEFAHMAYLMTEEWKNDLSLPFPARMETCLSQTYHMVVDDETFNDLCDSEDWLGCNYASARGLRLGEGYDSPYESVSIYRESLFNDSMCYDLSSIIAHEFMHKMEECHRNQAVRDNGDRDHKDEHLWYRNSDWESFEFHASERIATTLVHPVCGYPLDPVIVE